MKHATSWLLALGSWLILYPSAVIAQCDTNMNGYESPVRITINGVPENFSAIISFIGILDYGDGSVHNTQWMNPVTMQIQNCLQLSQNCQGTPYQYSEMTVSNSWIGQFTYNMVTYNVNVSHTEAYWDWRFLGYEKQGSVDYTKNCHGFAFGVGDWPADGGMGAIIILKEGACYAQTDPVHATIAVSTGCTHSIKVSGGLALNGSQPWPRVLATTEKFRESAIYKQHNSNGVTVINPINAHGLGASLGGLYKKL